jgi:hypothetical protein
MERVAVYGKRKHSAEKLSAVSSQLSADFSSETPGLSAHAGDYVGLKIFSGSLITLRPSAF